MRSESYNGETWHCRYQPELHQFKYQLRFFGFELNELEKLDRSSRFFGYNRRRIFSIRDRDYLDPRELPISSKITELLLKQGVTCDRVRLITTPRFFGYSFNPVNFYLCYDGANEIAAIVAEVNNTFGERHVYVLPRRDATNDGKQIRFQFPKEFFVSPFYRVEGDYELLFREVEDQLDIRVNIISGGRMVFNSRLFGNASPISELNYLKLLLTFPLTAWLTMSKIHWQALKLYFLRRVPLQSKPPLGPGTISSGRSGIWVKLRQAFLPVSGKGEVIGKESGDSLRIERIELEERR